MNNNLVNNPQSEESRKENVMNETAPEIKWKVKEIKTRINALSKEIKELKNQIRTPNHNITWPEFNNLSALKQEVTIYMVLQAFRRNKIHLKGVDHAQWLEENLDPEIRRELQIKAS